MIKSLFERAGPHAENIYLAADGKKGWELIQSAQLDLLVVTWNISKVECFELITRIKEEPCYKNIIVLINVTSLSNLLDTDVLVPPLPEPLIALETQFNKLAAIVKSDPKVDWFFEKTSQESLNQLLGKYFEN